MMVCRVGSRAASAARTATVFPAPTSPVITPMRCSVMHQPIRATASPWAAWRCSMPGARSRPNGVRVNPKNALQPVDHDATPPSVIAGVRR